jgi:hypothetical protein
MGTARSTVATTQPQRHEPDGQWGIDKTRRRLTEIAEPARSPLAGSAGAEATPFARLKVAGLALKVEAQRLSLDKTKRRSRRDRQHDARRAADLVIPHPLQSDNQARRSAVG